MFLGIQTPQYSCEVADLLHVWQAADRLGFRSAWLMDHLVPVVVPDTEPMLEAWTTLAALAAGTTRIRVGALVTANTFRPPAILARSAATIDRLSGGRLEVGLGAGWNGPEHVANGLEFPGVKDRLDMLDESCRVLRALWSEPVANFDGAHYKLVDAYCEPKPVQTPLPILIGGRGEKRTLRIVATHADRWNGSGSIEMLQHSVVKLHEHCAVVGRDPSTIELTVRNDFSLTKDRETADGELEQLAGFWKTTVDDARARTWIGPVDDVVESLLAFRAAGFHEAILALGAPYDGATVELLERVAADIMPKLGEHS
ncbi:MAG: Phthiodiolone/phenolphthiodiolone dimycocerosates ketoreductase [Actinomycetia bacterium]|nr:Phthiodiolone/phenolphthiodiolone dimycocerosates ketoreductase [Actinomycetes bacterium]